ncbi:MAG: glycosyltransferase family 2 protein [Prevotellaceae bacterium]|jgi:GT2 family glycosyltransferase|nr:glycosyltransferase family 2 protein [Prevotellaceae bacterium]
MSFRTKTAVVILNWNGLHFLERFLPGLLADTGGAEDVLVAVADNGSTDGSVEWLKATCPEAALIEFDRNYGFTGGYNRALRTIEAQYYVLLNSDVEVTENWLVPLVDYMDAHPEVAACAPAILSFANRGEFEYAGAAGGFIDLFGYPFCRGRILNHIERDNGQYDDCERIFWASGAALMARADLFRRAGGLDEDFFAHMEEIDLCWRLQLMGYEIRSVPASKVYHVGGGALPVNSPQKLYLNYRNNLMMMLKNMDGRRQAIIFARLLLDGAAALRYLVRGEFSYFRAVFRAHLGFWRAVPACRRKRREFARLRGGGTDMPVYRGSIVFKYFAVRGKIRFSDLDGRRFRGRRIF